MGATRVWVCLMIYNFGFTVSDFLHDACLRGFQCLSNYTSARSWESLDIDVACICACTSPDGNTIGEEAGDGRVIKKRRRLLLA